LAANVAVGGHDFIGKALAGWPALSMLASVKLFFGMFDHTDADRRTVDDGRTVRDDERTVPDDLAPASDDLHVGPDDQQPAIIPAANLPDRRTSGASIEEPAAHLINAARLASSDIARSGLPLSQDRLATTLRARGRSVSNAHPSHLVKILKSETETAEVLADAT